MKFIPYEKLSKKQQRELNQGRRATWSIAPVTRKPKSSRAYDRSKTKREVADD